MFLPSPTQPSSQTRGQVIPHRRSFWPTSFNRKDLLPLPPERMWKIERGVVRSQTLDEDGRAITLGFWGQGDLLGAPLCRMKPYHVECLTPVEISELPPGSCQLPDALDALLVHVWKSEEFLAIVQQRFVVQRLWGLLEWLAEEFGTATADGQMFDLRLTHQDMAETINATRVTVTRLLKQFEQAGKIRRVRYRYELLHPRVS